MRKIVFTVALLLVFLIFSCNTTKASRAKSVDSSVEKMSDTVRIANDELEYEVIIIDGGFTPWLHSTAKPRGFYSQNYLETRNISWVIDWNMKVRSPRNSRERELFLMEIDYQNGTNYGYEVNYLLYNYLVYFQLKNNIRLGSFSPRP